MNRPVSLYRLLLSTIVGAPLALTAQAAPVRMDTKHRELFQAFCVSCHGPEKQKGEFRLDDLAFELTEVKTAEKWQKILNAMNAGEMPPEEEKQPSRERKADFLEELSHTLVDARRSLADQKGAITLRRLNRREYANTLRDLLGVDISVAELPADSGSGSFDTVGANLFMSANQFEQYLGLGRQALDEAFEWQAAMGLEQKIRVEAEDTLKTARKAFEDDLDALERAKKWVALVDVAIAAPENAETAARLRKTAKNEDAVRREWLLFKGAPAPEDFGFQTVENNADKALGALSFGTKVGKGYGRPYREAYLNLPAIEQGAYFTIGGTEIHGYDALSLQIPYKWKTIVGDYIFRVRVAATEKATHERRFFEFGIDPRQGPVLSTHHISGTMDAPQTVEIPISLTRQHKEGANRTLYIREKGALDHFTVTRRVKDSAKRENGIGPEFAVWVDWLELERIPNSRKGGARALNALGISLTDDTKPDPEQLRAALERFCTEAFRCAKPESGYIEKLAHIYAVRMQAGDKHSSALKHTLAVALASPQFLYLAEPVPENTRRLLTGPELATRLSYFLWGAPPDPELRELAASGRLAEPETLAAQTTRLLEDTRSRDFTRPFVHQWLGLDRLDFFEFNRELFPRFDNSTKLAARQEVYETFEHILRTNASMRELLKSDYAILNPVLGEFYGISGIQRDGFQKVALTGETGHMRGGLLGMAAILAMGGNGERTSPVERGAWVLRKLLNEPPPPAPANVPQLARLAGKALTTRERLEAHQQDPQCASCHRKIDPLGFGLENFDAAGQWRTQDSYQVRDEKGKPVPGASKTWQVEAAAAFHKGPAFKDYYELREHIAGRAQKFARGFSLALIEYALGRTPGFRDETLADALLENAEKNNLSMRSFLHALVASEEFHSK